MSPAMWITLLVGIGGIVLALISFVEHRRYLGILCVVVSLCCLAATLIFQRQQEYEESGNDQIFVGILRPGVEYPLTPTTCDRQLPEGTAILSLGKTSGALLENKAQMYVFTLAGGSNLTIRKDRGMMLLSGIVADGEGHPIVKLTDNSFTIDSNRVLRDLTPNDHELFVYDTLNRLILHVDFRNSLNFYVVGTFAAPNHFPLTITDDEMRNGGDLVEAICISGPPFGWNL
jgi:hypothetical protein